MALFKRAEWHSGLTYELTCEQCRNTIRYTDNELDFRPWYPDGFIYCPHCKKPCRHRESYAIDRVNSEDASPVLFCTHCGNRFGDDDLFCSKCGTKRK